MQRTTKRNGQTSLGSLLCCAPAETHDRYFVPFLLRSVHSDDVTICRCIFMNNAIRRVFFIVFVRFFSSSKDDGFQLCELKKILSFFVNLFIYDGHGRLFFFLDILSLFIKFHFFVFGIYLLTIDNWFFVISKWEYSFFFPRTIIFLSMIAKKRALVCFIRVTAPRKLIVPLLLFFFSFFSLTSSRMNFLSR